MNETLMIPARVETGGCAEASRYRLLDKYKVYARFILIDTVTGYRSQSQNYSTIIFAR